MISGEGAYEFARQLEQWQANPVTGQWPQGWPPLHQITDQHIEPAVRAGIETRSAELDVVRDDPNPPSFSDIVAIERAHAVLWPIRQLWTVLLKTASTPARRDLAAVITPLLAAADTAAWLDPQLYERVAALHERRDELNLDQQDAALLNRIHGRFVDAGANLDPKAQQQLRTLDAREAELERDLDARMSAGLDAAAVHVTDRGELEGLDDDEIAVAAAAATERGLPGWLLTLAAPTVQPILARLADEGLRRRVHEASISRCSRGDDNDTRELLVELYRLRATRARLRGFAHHAEAVLSTQTAGSAETVLALLRALAPLAASKAAEEDAVLTDGRVAAADRLFLAEQARHRHRRPDHNSGDIREYLPLAAVLTGARKLVRHLHGVHLNERTDLPVHAPGVRVWEAVEDNGRRLGMVLVDLHQRAGKRAGAWTTEITAQSQLLGQRALVCMSLNLPPQLPDGGDVLLTPAQASTVFHEVGHVVHAMLSDVRYPSHSGFAHLPRDVVEAPAVIQEMWALHPHVLTRYARHHLTSEPIPIGLGITDLAPTRHGIGYRLVEDIATALLDLAWHSIGPDDEISSVEEFEQQILAAAGLADTVPPRYLSSFFRHSLLAGYDATYYAYVWSDVLAAQFHWTFADLGFAGPTRLTGSILRSALHNGSTRPGQYISLVGGQLHPAPLLLRHGFTATGQDGVIAGGAEGRQVRGSESFEADDREFVPFEATRSTEAMQSFEASLRTSIWGDDESDDLVLR